MMTSIWFAIFCYILAIIPFAVLFEIIHDHENLFWVAVGLGVVGCIIFLPFALYSLLLFQTSPKDLNTFITKVHRGASSND